MSNEEHCECAACECGEYHDCIQAADTYAAELERLHTHAQEVVHGYLKKYDAGMIGHNIFDEIVVDAKRLRGELAKRSIALSTAQKLIEVVKDDNQRLRKALNEARPWISGRSSASKDVMRRRQVVIDQIDAGLTTPAAVSSESEITDTEERKLQNRRGHLDGRWGRPPAQANDAYLRGHAEGRASMKVYQR